VLDARGKVIVLGLLSPDHVRMLYRELAAHGLAHTGNNTGGLVVAALLALVIGGALLAMSWWRRPRPGGDRSP
jgi:hypothetical protein